MRSLYVHQSLLSDPSPSLHKELVSLAEDLQKINLTDDSLIEVMLNLEIIQIKLQLYSEVSKSQILLDLACKQLHLEANLVGKLFSIFTYCCCCIGINSNVATYRSTGETDSFSGT